MEAAAGDSSASTRRMEILKGLPLLEMSDEARTLASSLMETTPLPQRAGPDALHIALATLNGVDHLLTRIRKEEEVAGPSLVRRSPRPAGEMPEQAA